LIFTILDIFLISIYEKSGRTNSPRSVFIPIQKVFKKDRKRFYQKYPGRAAQYSFIVKLNDEDELWHSTEPFIMIPFIMIMVFENKIIVGLYELRD